MMRPQVVLAWAVHFYTALGLACAAGMAMLIVEGDGGSFRLAFALMGLVQSCSMMARLTGPMEYAPAERRPSYIALAFGTVGPCAALAPLLGGQIVAWFGYTWLFGFSAAVALLALPFLGAGARAPARRAA